METKLEYSVKGLYKVPVEQAKAELDRISELHGGKLNPEDVVAESKSKNSVLHEIFEWDNKKAADKWRIQQARDLIRNIRFVTTNEEVSISGRFYVNVREEPGEIRKYIPVKRALLNETARKDLLQQAKADMEIFCNKYKELEELGKVKAVMLETMAYLS